MLADAKKQQLLASDELGQVQATSAGIWSVIFSAIKEAKSGPE
jgi:hypothetical protein